MTGANLIRLSGLAHHHLLRLEETGLLRPFLRWPRAARGQWTLFRSDSLLLARVAAAFTRLGSAASDAAPLLLALRALPPCERESLVDRTVLVRWQPGISRLDVYLEGEVPEILGSEPLFFRLRDLIDGIAAGRRGSR